MLERDDEDRLWVPVTSPSSSHLLSNKQSPHPLSFLKKNIKKKKKMEEDGRLIRFHMEATRVSWLVKIKIGLKISLNSKYMKDESKKKFHHSSCVKHV